MERNTFYITTPIYYVNDKPHIGHAYTTILADVLARYHRLLDVPTHFLTGTDEHGQKVQRAAEQHRITPRQQCDRTVVRFQQLWERLGITHDDFIRTTEERHQVVVRQILQDLYDRGEIYAAEYEGWYCVPCERFFTQRDLRDGLCPECSRAVERLFEKNYFFRMSAYQDWLLQTIEGNPDFIRPEHRRQETLGFLRQPLNDLCISRPKNRLNWGIELPFDQEYVTYVWFDALVNYISAIGYGADPERFERWWPASCHLIGKDILTTHTVYWPTMLKAIGVALPRTVFAHGWWLVGRDKMSKSLGNVVNPMEMADTYGVDAFRYFLMAEMTLGQDAAFTEEAFVNRYNADLANDLGNLASRVLTMVQRSLGGTLPEAPAPAAAEEELVSAVLAAVGHMQSYLTQMQLDRGIAEVLAAVRAGNRYFDRMKPWKLAKQGDGAALARVLYHSSECLRIVSGLLFPVMPGKMTALRQALGLGEAAARPRFAAMAAWGGLAAGTRVGALGPLFPRIAAASETLAEAPRGKSAAKASAKAGPEAENLVTVGIEDFAKVRLRTGVVVDACRIEESDRLLKLQVEIGADIRQIVAGIAGAYDPDSLLGRTVIVVTNLEPAVLFGVESDGMLLAARKGRKMRLLTVDGEIPSGAAVS
ncbi:MAG: methionine--tRNA ligase [Lentisphaeria bacterium]|nr:methionine--tRNA ligase [Lentisphaeria bacterium]